MPDDARRNSSGLREWIADFLLPPASDRAEQVRALLLRPFFTFVDGHYHRAKPIRLAGEDRPVTLREDQETRHLKYLGAFEREPLGQSHPDFYEHWLEAHVVEQEKLNRALKVGDWGSALHESRERVERDFFTALWILHQRSGDSAYEDDVLWLQRLHELLRRRAETDDGDDEQDSDRGARKLRGDLRRLHRELAESQDSGKKAAAEAEAARSEVREVHERFANLEGRLAGLERNKKASDTRIATLGSENSKLRAEKESASEGRAAIARERDDLDATLRTEAQRRSGEAKKAASREQEVVELRRQLDSVPAGISGARALLQAEYDRADDERAIAQGGRQREADAVASSLKKLLKRSDELFPAFVAAATHGHGPPVHQADLRLRTLGGGDRIGASCHVLELGADDQRYRLMVDCGLRVNAEIDHMGPALDPENLPDAVVVTHAHIDHCGWLPALVHLGYEGRIYCTPETKELVRIMLDDSLRNLRMKMGQLRLHGRYTADDTIPEPYTAADLEYTLSQMQEVPFGVEIDLGSIFTSG